jgi:hypothetical protein
MNQHETTKHPTTISPTSRGEAVQAEIDALWDAYLAPTTEPTLEAAARGPAAQGDLLFTPTDAVAPHWAQPIPAAGIDLIATGNGHRLIPTPGSRVEHAVVHGDRHVIAVLHITGTATVVQPRGRDAHVPIQLGPGVWQVRRQTEVTPTPTRSTVRWVVD